LGQGIKLEIRGQRVPGYQFESGGVSHYRSHCCSVIFRGLKYGGKYSAVIGRKPRFWYVPDIKFQAMGYFKPITALCFPTYIKPRNL